MGSDALREITAPLLPPEPPKPKGGRPRPAQLHADTGDDFPRCRQALPRRGANPQIARRGNESRERLGRRRGVVEQTHSWLKRFRRRKVRDERRVDIHRASLTLGCALICGRSLCPSVYLDGISVARLAALPRRPSAAPARW
jgi:hypothetical protein